MNQLTDIHEIWYEHDAIGFHPTVLYFNLPTVSNNVIADMRICDVEQHLI
jgi:hypothetical protein